MPVVQRLVEGMAAAVVPLADPQAPLIIGGPASGAEQVAVLPPPEPAQLHDHGPVPATDDDTPAEQRLADGADDTATPFAEPQVPLTGGGVKKAEQLAVLPPFDPPHVQVQGPVPATEEDVPAVQRFAVGAAETVVPFDEPHTPLTGGGGVS